MTIEAVVVYDDHIDVKFLQSIKVSSITDSNFVVTDSSNHVISSAFKPIDLSLDYNSISRTISLLYDQLTTAGTYTLTVSGLLDAANRAIPTATYNFDVPTLVSSPVPPPEPVHVVDYSIKSDVFDSDIVAEPNQGFYIIGYDPNEHFVSTDYANGRVTIAFSSPIDISYADSIIDFSSFIWQNSAPFIGQDLNNGSLTSTNTLGTSLVRAQAKQITTSGTRWFDVAAMLSYNSDNTQIRIDFPSTDATPVYNTPGHVYFQSGWKYRIKVSRNLKSVSATPSTLMRDFIWTFMPDLSPMFIDDDEVLSIYPDADPIEVAELINYYSSQALDLASSTNNSVTESSPLLREYTLAATACALSRIYNISGGADESVFQLGDLSVTNRSSVKGSVNRGNAVTWCELASVIRAEIVASEKGRMQTIVRGDKQYNPIPIRDLRRAEWRGFDIYDNF